MSDTYNKRSIMVRTVLVVSIMLVIAAIHAFRVGTYLTGNAYKLYYSFASDILLPFGAYFLLSMNEIQFRLLKKWHIKVLIVFGAMTFSEVLQYFGIYLFGVTFDYLDIIMYAFGALLAAFIDTQVFEKFVPYWNYNAPNK